MVKGKGMSSEQINTAAFIDSVSDQQAKCHLSNVERMTDTLWQAAAEVHVMTAGYTSLSVTWTTNE